jgi:VanZ family protein
MKRFLAFFALLTLLLLIPMPPVGKITNSIGDMLHVPLFACLSFASFQLLRQRRTGTVIVIAVTCWFGTIVFAALTELMQWATGRTPSRHDFFADICGVSIGVLLALAIAWPSRRWRIACSLAAVLLLVIAVTRPASILIDVARQHSEMPVLASFERAGEISRWTTKESRIARVAEHATSGAWSLRVDLRPGTYPGTSLPFLPSDWSAYDALVSDVWLAGTEPLRIVVKVTDRDHNNQHEDRFQRTFVLSPGANSIEIRLADIENAPQHRRLNIQEVATLSYFTVRLPFPRTLFLDNVHLR